ncbi:putative cytokinin dehydrogenase [Lupinus albus]|uniref:Putative cytokinin dehydrogenase n=1 Tax=Lupinus albus TaxID=3870 RepID=A0A6A4NLX7_LUPAL|nr:putative cytokinin dehydrogenase [Lupinus albus]
MRVKWLRLLYNDFSAFSGDQEHLISYLVYIIELLKYYDNNSQAQRRLFLILTLGLEVENLVQGLKFVPTFQFEKDVSYEEFLNRVHAEEVILRAKGLWDVPHPWFNMFFSNIRF